MAEIIFPLIPLSEGETHTADHDGAVVITGRHTHSDVLRYVAADIGYGDALFILRSLAEAAASPLHAKPG